MLMTLLETELTSEIAKTKVKITSPTYFTYKANVSMVECNVPNFSNLVVK